MRRLRFVIHSLLALVLCAQSLGVAMAARDLAPAHGGMQMSMESQSAMPCHAKMKMAQHGGEKPACCNAACPDMLTCVFAAIVLSAAMPSLPMIGTSASPVVLSILDPPSAPQGAAFRPPISRSA